MRDLSSFYYILEMMDMSRPKKKERDVRNVQKCVRLTKTENNHLKVLKIKTGMNTSELIVDALRYYSSVYHNLPGFGSDENTYWKYLTERFLG